MSDPTKPEFSKLRASIWPIHTYELKKFLPMAAIMMLILFNYTVVRCLKDTLIISDKGSGAEVVNFLKAWIVFPASVIFVIIFAKLSNMLSREKLYYACLLPFIIFFGAFAFLIYPAREALHPSPEAIQALQASYPFLHWVFPIYGLWTYSTFYVLAELWGNIGINILFWQFANHITPTDQAKRFYPLISMVGNVALIVAGTSLERMASIDASGAENPDQFIHMLQQMIFFVVLSGIAIGVIYFWMNRTILKDPKYNADVVKSKKGKESKPKLSLVESFKYLFSSKYMGYIAILVLGYGMTINLIEVTWKAQVKEAFPDALGFSAFMGGLYWKIGLLTIVILFLTKGVVRRFGWYTGAIATPVMIVGTGALFFAFVIFRDQLGGPIAFLGLTPIMAAVHLGSLQNAFGKGTKYALFDPTREMTYIPLDQEMKVKGKAAVDVVGGRLGKSAGGWIQMSLLMALGSAGTQQGIAPYLAGAMVLLGFAWMWAVGRLSGEYTSLLAKKKDA